MDEPGRREGIPGGGVREGIREPAEFSNQRRFDRERGHANSRGHGTRRSRGSEARAAGVC